MNISLSQFCRDNDLPKTSVYRKCQDLGIETANGFTSEVCDLLLREFDIAPKSEKVIDVEAGNHSTALALPELPKAYTLEVLRDSEAVGFEDPLAVAAQFLQVADGLTEAMQADIQQRQQRLQQTKSAKDAIAAKAQQLQLESRLYQLQTQQLDQTLTTETQDLQAALQQLQSLGKPPSGEASQE